MIFFLINTFKNNGFNWTLNKMNKNRHNFSTF